MRTIISTLKEYDLTLVRSISRYHSLFLDKGMIAITSFGDWWWGWLLIGMLFFLLPEYNDIGKAMLIACGIVALIGEILLKPFLKRRRPFRVDNSILLKISPPMGHSFPSTHSAVSFAASMVYFQFAGMTALSALFFLLALWVSISRLYLQVHFLSDIIAGISIGISVAVLVSVLPLP